MNFRATKYFLFLILMALFILSCQKREWDNPFDPDCPKEIFTPGTITATQSGNSIKISWTQSNKNISGFKLYRNSNNGQWEIRDSPDKYIRTWTDNNFEGGVTYGYKIIAVAGNNLSNERQTTITPILGASIITKSPSNITFNSAVSGGNITSDGGSPVTARGVCWSTNSSPTIANNKTTDGSGSGSFTSSLTGLTANTTYYVRAYATNSQGTAYGGQLYFSTTASSLTVTDADGNTYNTVTIGTQVWMAENLKTTKYRDGTSIPNITDDAAWLALTTGAYCCYNNDISNQNTYGALYNWYAAISEKICPLGWHVPTNSEWAQLREFLGGYSVAGGKMKSVSGWTAPNKGATNESGFSALPGGNRGSYGKFFRIGDYAFWHSTTEYNESFPSFWHIAFEFEGLYLTSLPKSEGGSIRCIKD